MSQGYQNYDQTSLYYLTFQVVKWVDIFTRLEYKEIITESFTFCRDSKGLKLYAYVIMTNHIHLIARAKENYKLSDIIWDFKKLLLINYLIILASHLKVEVIGCLKDLNLQPASMVEIVNTQIWTHENHAIELHSIEFIEQKLNYIHNNPVRVGIVNKPEDYIFSSARNYSGLEGKIEIDSLFLINCILKSGDLKTL